MIKLPKFKNYVDQPVKYLQRKLDGHMYHTHVGISGDIKCITKNGKDKTDKVLRVDRIFRQLKALPYVTHLMVELHCPGEPATTVAHMLAHADQRLEIAAFAAPVLGGLDLFNSDLCAVMNELNILGLGAVKAVRINKGHQPSRKKLLDVAIKKGIEGWVLKQSHMEGWYKLKPVKTIDAFVVGATESTSKTYKGHLKAIKLAVYNADGTQHDLGLCGGFEKIFKLSMLYADMKKYLMGKVLLIEHNGFTVNKKLIWPRVVNDDNGLVIRTDKDANQCTTEQLT